MPTEQCNYRCVYCNEPFQKGAMSLEMQNALISYLRKQMHSYNHLDIAWFGGEPLLAINEIAYMSRQFIGLCRAARIPYTSNITTNGYLLTPENLQTLIKCHVTSYQVTVDGLADTHNRQKPLAGGGKTFETVLGNLRYIRDHVQTRLIRIVIRTNITREIYEKLDDYIDFFADEFGEDERFSFFIRPAMDWGGEFIAAFKGELVDDRAVQSVYQRLIQRERLKRFDSHLGFFAVGGTVCAAAKHNFYTIEPDGKLHKCSQMFDDDFDTEVGQLYEDGSVFIDDSKAARWLLDTSSCPQKGCFFAGNCLSEFCPKLRLGPQKRHTWSP